MHALLRERMKVSKFNCRYLDFCRLFSRQLSKATSIDILVFLFELHCQNPKCVHNYVYVKALLRVLYEK